MKQLPMNGLLLIPLVTAGIVVQAQPKQTPPNLVFIMADQFRGDAMGCMGKEPVKTPNLDKLASEGVIFTNAVSSYSTHATNGIIDEVILFDRIKDPYQLKNIASQNPQIIRQLKKQLKEWLTKTKDPFANYLN